MPQNTKKSVADMIELKFSGPSVNREKAVKALSKLGFTDMSDAELSPKSTSELGKRLADIRLGENITQQELSKATGIPQRYISEMENGKRAISRESAKKLAKALKVRFQVFL